MAKTYTRRNLVAPAGLSFDDLDLTYDESEGLYHYDPAVLEHFCVANRIDLDTVIKDDAERETLVGLWYVIHRSEGGNRSSAAESIFRHVLEADDRKKEIPCAVTTRK